MSAAAPHQWEISQAKRTKDKTRLRITAPGALPFAMLTLLIKRAAVRASLQHHPVLQHSIIPQYQALQSHRHCLCTSSRDMLPRAYRWFLPSNPPTYCGA